MAHNFFYQDWKITKERASNSKKKKKKILYAKKATDSGTYVPIMQHLKLAFVITIRVWVEKIDSKT